MTTLRSLFYFYGTEYKTAAITSNVTYDPYITNYYSTTETNIDTDTVERFRAFISTSDTFYATYGYDYYAPYPVNATYPVNAPYYPAIKSFQHKFNMQPNIKTRAHLIIFKKETNKEKTAIDTLREMITELEFRKYIKYGFILVKGKSGRVYQIFRNKYHTKVYENGVLVEEICVRIKDKEIPPTDNVIAFKIMVEADEAYFHQIGNVYNMKKAA